jgi:enoyl-CoA hydratase/carnithine racemase
MSASDFDAPIGSGLVRYGHKDGIGYITLGRPEKLNAFTDQMLLDFQEALLQFDLDDEALLAILSGDGRAFSSGADVRQRQLRPIEEMEKFAGPQSPETRRIFHDVYFNWINFKPLIAAVHGYVLGMAMMLTFFADMIVAAETTQFQVTEIPRGNAGGSYIAAFNHLGGGAFGREVVFTGRMFTAREAFDHGLITRVAPDGQHVTVAEELAGAVLKNPPLSVRQAVRVHRLYLQEHMRLARVATEPRPALHLTRDFRESAMAFVEKREQPAFEGR